MYRWGPLTCTHLHPATTRQQMKYQDLIQQLETSLYINIKDLLVDLKLLPISAIIDIMDIFTGGEGVQWEFDGFIRLDWIGQCTKHVQSTNGLLM